MEDSEKLAEARLDRLIAHLPKWAASGIHWIRQPQAVWLRVPTAILLILASFLAILPFFGLWMLPVGILLLAKDVRPLRRAVYALINSTAARHPKWFGEPTP